MKRLKSPPTKGRNFVKSIKPAPKAGKDREVVNLLRKPPVVNVIKAPPPIRERAKEKTADLDARTKMRNRYRESAGVVMESCLDNLAQLDTFATMHTVTFPNGKVREIPAFTITAVGGPLNTSGATITRWLKRGMLPEPVLETSRGKVYHIEEVRSFVRVIGKHQREFRQYRDEHEQVKDGLFEQSSDIRRGLFSAK